MSSVGINVSVGSPVPLTVDLKDGNEAAFPQAFIFDPDETLLATVDLVHTVDGLYTNNDYLMPDLAYIRVLYKTFTTSDHTTESYYRCTDIFAKGAAGESTGGGGGSAVSVGAPAHIIGEIISGDLIGELNADTLVAKLLDPETSVKLQENETNSETTEVTLDGDLGPSDIDGETGNC